MTMLFGHRGIPSKCMENSMSGFFYCIEHEVDGIETDVHLTKDYVPVIMHDETIDRTTDGYGFIKNYFYDELKQYHLKNGEKIPTLDDVLKLVANSSVKLNLELKTDIINYPLIEKIVLQHVAKYKVGCQILYSSFNINTLIKLAKLDHTLDLNFLFSGKKFPMSI